MSNAGNEQGKKDNQERKLNKLTRKSPGHPMGVGGGGVLVHGYFQSR